MDKVQRLKVLRGILSELRQVLPTTEKQLRSRPIVTHLLSEYRKNQVTGDQLCKAHQELNYQAETYLTYLQSTRQLRELRKEFRGRGELSTSEAASRMGFTLPHDKPPQRPEQ